MEGTGLISEERLRQVMQEGWTAEHDDEHSACELSQAAVAYISHAAGLENGYCDPDEHPEVPREWPWDKEWWKPEPDAIRCLVKAGALIAAEIDRLQRVKDEQKPTGLTIRVTARHMADRGCWSEYCDLAGIHPYALNEGMPDDTEFTLTESEARQLELIK